MKYFITSLYCFLGISMLVAQDQLKTQSVSIFKNSTAFFVKSGTVETNDKSWSIYGDTIPQALNGTFWLSSPSNDFKLVKAFQKEVITKEEATALDFAAMLSLNNGAMVLLQFKDTSYRGKIISLQKELKKDETPNLYAPLFALEMASGKTMIFTYGRIKMLTHLEFDKMPEYRYTATKRKQVPSLQINFKSDKKRQELDMMYLSNGLAWKPDYKINLIEENKARLSLRSTVINNVEDIKAKQLNLVAGVPNFKYATKLSELIDFINLLVISNEKYDALSNIAIPQNSYNYNPYSENSDPGTLSTPQHEGTAIEDLYFYSLEDVELKKGERGFFDIFTVDVPVKHIYEAILDNNNISYSLEYTFIKKTNPVIHTIKLTNNSPYTWTAAPALVMKNNKGQNAPISQDKLGYTSQKDNISVKLTEAPDVSVQFLENETNRDIGKKTVKRGKYTYYNDLVTVDAEITVQNYKRKAINLDIKRLISGELKKSSETWQKAPRVQFGYTLNKKTDVCWELKLEAGERKVIKYSYSFYTSEHQ